MEPSNTRCAHGAPSQNECLICVNLALVSARAEIAILRDDNGKLRAKVDSFAAQLVEERGVVRELRKRFPANPKPEPEDGSPETTH